MGAGGSSGIDRCRKMNRWKTVASILAYAVKYRGRGLRENSGASGAGRRKTGKNGNCIDRKKTA